jgi:hypothetical protein
MRVTGLRAVGSCSVPGPSWVGRTGPDPSGLIDAPMMEGRLRRGETTVRGAPDLPAVTEGTDGAAQSPTVVLVHRSLRGCAA